MAIDSKYGRVTLERGTIGDDEPVVVFRARDRALLDTLDFYAERSAEIGADYSHWGEGVDRARDAVFDWQREHETKVPDTAASTQTEEGRTDA